MNQVKVALPGNIVGLNDRDALAVHAVQEAFWAGTGIGAARSARRPSGRDRHVAADVRPAVVAQGHSARVWSQG